MSHADINDAGLWKAWIVICSSEADRLGLSPITSPQFHVLLYLANTLAQLFDVVKIRGRVLKRGDYPFYPEAQSELDRLAFNGVLKIEKVDFGSRGHMTAHYSITHTGQGIFQSLQVIEEAQRTSRLFRELLCASFGKFLSAQTAIGAIDANYGDNQVLPGEVVDFAEWSEENKNIEVAKYLIDRLRSLKPQVDRDGVRLYCAYLDQALETA